jgi:transcriptional regulator with XRE-family HTH domain
MSYKSLNAADLADKIGVQRSNLSHILNGRNLPSSQFIEKLLNFFPELDAGWLITGKGNMIRAFETVTPIEEEKNSIKENKNVIQPVKDTPKSIPREVVNSQKVEKIVFFYTDKSFTVYNPES